LALWREIKIRRASRGSLAYFLTASTILPSVVPAGPADSNCYTRRTRKEREIRCGERVETRVRQKEEEEEEEEEAKEEEAPREIRNTPKRQTIMTLTIMSRLANACHDPAVISYYFPINLISVKGERQECGANRSEWLTAERLIYHFSRGTTAPARFSLPFCRQ